MSLDDGDYYDSHGAYESESEEDPSGKSDSSAVVTVSANSFSSMRSQTLNSKYACWPQNPTRLGERFGLCREKTLPRTGRRRRQTSPSSKGSCMASACTPLNGAAWCPFGSHHPASADSGPWRQSIHLSGSADARCTGYDAGPGGDFEDTSQLASQLSRGQAAWRALSA